MKTGTSSFLSKSGGASIGWNDPLNAYLAIVNFLLKNAPDHQEILQTFFVNKYISYNSNWKQTSQNFIFLSPPHSSGPTYHTSSYYPSYQRQVVSNQKHRLMDLLKKKWLDSKAQERFIQVPRILVIAIERHSPHSSSLRTQQIITQETIQIPQDLFLNKEKIVIDLVGVVCSQGSGTHMVSFVQKNRKWYYCNDTFIDERPFKSINMKNACMFVFKRSE